MRLAAAVALHLASEAAITSMPKHGHPEQMLSWKTVRQRKQITDSAVLAEALYRVVDFRNRLVLHTGLTRKEADRVAQSKTYLKVEPDAGGKRNPPVTRARKGGRRGVTTRRSVWFPESAF
jgi:hypothetical protein